MRMPSLMSVINNLKRKMAFAKQGFRRPEEVGTIFPSPGRVAKAMVEPIDMYGVRSAAEAGPGNGAVTREFLKCMPDYARLTVYEPNPSFCADLKKNINDRRLNIVNAGVECLNIPVDVVISSIPRAAFAISKGRSRTLDAIVAHLSPDGQFVHHQYIPFMGVFKHYFASVEHKWVWCYFWPASIYVCSEPKAPQQDI